MSGAERVRSFNPILLLIWAFQIIIFVLDLQGDGRVSWSIPIIGSFFFVQLYMIWKTNYEQMEEERRSKMAEMLGGPKNVPEIDPTSQSLKTYYKSAEPKKEVSGPMLNVDATSENERSENVEE